MSTLLGPHNWSSGRDSEGYRSYSLTWLVEASNGAGTDIDDPSVIANTAGLPLVGSRWSDLAWITGSDAWAFCSPEYSITPYESQPGEAPLYYLFSNTFTQTPAEKCQDKSIENPLNLPPDININWTNKKIQRHVDRDGRPYRTSTGELLFGQETETDDADWDVVISLNSTWPPPLATVNALRHNLHNGSIWGLPAETIKFSKYQASRKMYGKCFFYTRSTMSFSIRPDWNQYLPDKGRMQLVGGGTATDPDDWVVSKDIYGENKPLLRLDILGKPVVSDKQIPATIVRRPYPKGNLLLLGIPSVL